jgi:hypothetical protein
MGKDADDQYRNDNKIFCFINLSIYCLPSLNREDRTTVMYANVCQLMYVICINETFLIQKKII